MTAPVHVPPPPVMPRPPRRSARLRRAGDAAWPASALSAVCDVLVVVVDEGGVVEGRWVS